MTNPDPLAQHLGISIRVLRQQLVDFGISAVMSEATRMAHGEIWDDKTQPRTRLLTVTPELRHVVAAARALLEIPNVPNASP